MAAVKDTHSGDTSRNPRSTTTLVILGVVAVALFAGLCAPVSYTHLTLPTILLV